MPIGSWKVKKRVCEAMIIIKPIRKYASSNWDSHMKKSISKIEMVKCRAAHFTLSQHHNTSSVEEMLEVLERPMMKQLQHAAHPIMLLKITNSLARVKSQDFNLQPCSGQRGLNLK